MGALPRTVLLAAAVTACNPYPTREAPEHEYAARTFVVPPFGAALHPASPDDFVERLHHPLFRGPPPAGLWLMDFAETHDLKEERPFETAREHRRILPAGDTLRVERVVVDENFFSDSYQYYLLRARGPRAAEAIVFRESLLCAGDDVPYWARCLTDLDFLVGDPPRVLSTPTPDPR